MKTSLVKILCVDDEPMILESLESVLRRKYSVFTAKSASEGLALIQQQGPFAVILSDMRMPGMDGAKFLAKAREIAPDTVRMLLTGYAEMSAAIGAVNEGQIFRFLTKPCPQVLLLSAMRDAVQQHELITAQKVLLEQTLRGSIQALIDILSLSNPRIFGLATGIRESVREMALGVGLEELWAVEVAAMLYHIGYMILVPEIAEKVHSGVKLEPAEEEKVKMLPKITEQLLEDIPRLEPVRSIIRNQSRPRLATAKLNRNDAVEVGTEALRIALAFDQLIKSGMSEDSALSLMKSRNTVYDPELLDVFSSLKNLQSGLRNLKEIKIAEIKAGMILNDDLKLRGGTLLAPRGYTVTQSFIERIRGFPADSVKEPICVVVKTKEG